MKRRSPLVSTVPADLRTFISARWIQDAIDKGDPFLAPLVRRLTSAELFANWYARGVVARARYRQALTDAVGQAAGDRWFYGR